MRWKDPDDILILNDGDDADDGGDDNGDYDVVDDDVKFVKTRTGSGFEVELTSESESDEVED